MATDNIYSGLIAITRANTAISSQLGFYPNSTIPIVQAGVLDESVTALPAITIRMESLAELNKKVGDVNFILNCFGSNEIESFKLANTLIEEWDDTTVTFDGWSMQLTASAISSVVNPVAKEVNTPVAVRVVYWR